jgi:hypothetical protein
MREGVAAPYPQETYADPPDNRIILPQSVKEFGQVTGMSISVHDKDHPPESANAFRQAMRSAGFSVDYETFYGPMLGDFMLSIAHK